MLDKLKYSLVHGIMSVVAWLPLSVLYVFSDFLYLIIYRLAGYRRKLVAKNLSQCFPDKTEEERKAIERRFYHNFADIMVESIKMLHISPEEMKSRVEYVDINIIEDFVAQGKNVLIYFSHCANWEWATSIPLHTDAPAQYGQVYRPLRNKIFDRLMFELRSRFGDVSYPKTTVLRDLIRLRKEGKITVTGFMSDQKPSHNDSAVPVMFLNRPTAFISGTETLARKLGMAVVYWDMQRVARGRYTIVTKIIDPGTFDCPAGNITKKYASLLQDSILRAPEAWLWSHNRWKYPVTMP